MATQSQLYERLEAAELDPELSWSEAELPERVRTKHVHRLHPYLGKFVPQLVENFLARYFEQGQTVLDPFSGSGTTLVECSTFGTNSVGIDISAFNVLLTRVKTGVYNPFVVERDLREGLARLEQFVTGRGGNSRSTQRSLLPRPRRFRPVEYLREWYDIQALAELLFYRSLLSGTRAANSWRSVVASSPLRPPHNTLWPRLSEEASDRALRVCEASKDLPTDARGVKFLRRYTLDSISRVKEYARLRTGASARVLHGDARTADYDAKFDGLITSPPYPGRIDYHEQHRYAYELLGLEDRRSDEMVLRRRGRARWPSDYVSDMVAVFANAKRHLRPGAPVLIVIDDARSLYDGVLSEAGLVIEERRKRHVNRRTGRRNGEFFEEIIIARA